jgi:hypothetical protein
MITPRHTHVSFVNEKHPTTASMPTTEQLLVCEMIYISVPELTPASLLDVSPSSNKLTKKLRIFVYLRDLLLPSMKKKRLISLVL